MHGVVRNIIVTEFCERIAYYGFAASLVLFFQTQLGMSNADADVQFSIWSAACYLTPLLGGYIADTKLDRYKTILVFIIFSCFFCESLVICVEFVDVLFRLRNWSCSDCYRCNTESHFHWACIFCYVFNCSWLWGYKTERFNAWCRPVQ